MKNELENVFVVDLLELSPKAIEYADILWLIYKMKAPVPLKFVSFHLNEYQPFEIENKLKILSEAKLIEWFGHGKYSIGKPIAAFENSEIFLLLSKELNSIISDKEVTQDAFRNMIFEHAGNKLLFYCSNKLIEFLITALSKIILDASPSKPIFIGKLIRELCSMWRISLQECKQILYYYLYKFLNLIEIEDGIFVNISYKAFNKIRQDQELLKIYFKQYKPKLEIQKPIMRHWNDKEAEKLRKHFPWVGLS